MASINLGTAYLELAPSTKGLNKEIRDSFKQAEQQAQKFSNYSGDEISKSFGGAGDAVSSSLDKAKGPISGFFNSIKTTAGNIFTGVAMGFGMKIFDTVSGALSKVFSVSVGAGMDRYINIEQAEAKLSGLGHTAEGVEAIMDNALDSVRGTAYGMGDAASVAATMVASGIEPGERLTDVLKLVGDAATIAGTDMGSMGSIFSKVAASNKLQMDSVNQLQDQGIPVLSKIAEHLGITTEEAQKMASEGKISFDLFAEVMEETLGGAALKSGETFEGALANVKAALGRGGLAIMEPLMDAATPLMAALSPAIDSLVESLEPATTLFGEWITAMLPTLIGWVEKLPDLFSNAGERLGGLGDSFGMISAWWSSTGQPVFASVSGFVTGQLVPALATIGEKVWDILVPAFGIVSTVLRDTVFPIIGKVVGIIKDNLGPVLEVVGNVITAITPVVSHVAGVFGDFLVPAFEKASTIVREGLLPVFQNIGGWIVDVGVPAFMSLIGYVQTYVLPIFATIVGYIADRLVPVFQTVSAFVMDTLVPIFMRIVAVLGEKLAPIFADVQVLLQDKVLPTLDKVGAFVRDKMMPVFKDFAERVVVPMFELIGDAISTAWTYVIKPVFEWLWDFISNTLGPIFEWLWEKVVDPVFTKMGDAVDYFGQGWEQIWKDIRNQAAKPVNFVIETVWNNGLRKLINMIPGIDDVGEISKIPTYQTGGFVNMPWSAANRDPYLGYTPKGMFRFEGEEFIFPRDFTRKHRAALEAMLSGDLEVPGYARGGAVRPVPQGHSGWNGGRYRSGKWHGGLDFPAPSGTPISAMWAGSVAKAMRLNRSYGHHAVLSHGDGLQTLYAHMSSLGVNAGQAVGAGATIGRVGSTGNSTGPHLHLEVRLNGKQLDPTPYLRGAAAPTGTGDDDPGVLSQLLSIPGDIAALLKSMRENLNGDWGAMIRDAMSNAIDGFVQSIKDLIPGFANGTDFAPGGWAKVGERGTELVNLPRGSQVAPHELTRRALSPNQQPADMDAVLRALLAMTEEFSGMRADLQAQRRLTYQGGF